MPDNGFSGFSRETVRFLWELYANNCKSWFDEHKADYTTYVQKPMQQLAAALSPTMHAIDPHIETRPNKIISRIYRDTRFSKDKSPYRNNVWMTFKRTSETWQDDPAYYFEITPETYSYGMGFYASEKDTMDRFRAVIDHDPEAFREKVAFYREQTIFTLKGEDYKRVRNPETAPDLMEWYQKKNFYLVCSKKLDERLWSPVILKDLQDGFNLLADFYHYLFWVKQVDYRKG